MELNTVIEVGAVVLAGLGGASALILAFSSWLSRIWADRLMAKETARHDRELEELRSRLASRNEAALAELTAALDVAKQKHLSGFDDKIKIYRLIVDVVAEALADFDLHEDKTLDQQEALEKWDRFNRGRMRAYGYLAMFAPQPVIDAADELFDHLILVSRDQVPYDWTEVRRRVLALVNRVRADIGFDPDEIEYRGQL